MQGWADPDQKTKANPCQRVYARAFVIQERDTHGELVAMVCTENWAATDRVKRMVLARFKRHKLFGALLKDDNLMLMASHQHSAPGGYSDSVLYEPIPGG